MAEQSELERTEPASPRRLEHAREEGQVPRSPELSTFGVLAAGATGLWFTGASVLDGLSNMVRSGLAFGPRDLTDDGALTARLGDLALAGFAAVAPMGGLSFLVAILAPLALSGWVFSSKLPAPDFTRLNRITRIFSWHGLAELFKSIVKATLVGSVAVWAVWQQKEVLLTLADQPFGAAVSAAARVTGLSLFVLVGALLVVVAFDVPFQLWQHGQKLRMSHDELRREAKETEGDPGIKARIRNLQREAARKRMMSEVPKAAVIVTNPTHYAVALAYRDGASGAPRVVAKGSDLLAQRIRELAREHNVPVLESPPLARALYRHVDLDTEIPETLYGAVAEVLVYVFRLKRYFSDGGVAPEAPRSVPVPTALDPGPGGA